MAYHWNFSPRLRVLHRWCAVDKSARRRGLGESFKAMRVANLLVTIWNICYSYTWAKALVSSVGLGKKSKIINLTWFEIPLTNMSHLSFQIAQLLEKVNKDSVHILHSNEIKLVIRQLNEHKCLMKTFCFAIWTLVDFDWIKQNVVQSCKLKSNLAVNELIKWN